ncbi:hypothetical protein AAF712_015956 [Marasmius tenuissimus]|uniref:Uncharacterized protein n=1 Tax=Marasmius tenuissimus TaxID=585030 RepID=A0ABR2Z964_9AGAR
MSLRIARVPEGYKEAATKLLDALSEEWVDLSESCNDPLHKFLSPKAKRGAEKIYWGIFGWRCFDILVSLEGNAQTPIMILRTTFHKRMNLLTGFKTLSNWVAMIRDVNDAVNSKSEVWLALSAKPTNVTEQGWQIYLIVWQYSLTVKHSKAARLNKVLNNLAQAAFVISFFKMGYSDLPSDKKKIQEALIEAASDAGCQDLASLIIAAFKPGKIAPSNLRGVLYVALAVTPFMLLSDITVVSKDIPRRDLIIHWLYLGNCLPPLLALLTKELWRCIKLIVDGKATPLDALKQFLCKAMVRIPKSETEDTTKLEQAERRFFDRDFGMSIDDITPSATNEQHRITLRSLNKEPNSTDKPDGIVRDDVDSPRSDELDENTETDVPPGAGLSDSGEAGHNPINRSLPDGAPSDPPAAQTTETNNSNMSLPDPESHTNIGSQFTIPPAPIDDHAMNHDTTATHLATATSNVAPLPTTEPSTNCEPLGPPLPTEANENASQNTSTTGMVPWGLPTSMRIEDASEPGTGILTHKSSQTTPQPHQTQDMQMSNIEPDNDTVNNPDGEGSGTMNVDEPEENNTNNNNPTRGGNDAMAVDEPEEKKDDVNVEKGEDEVNDTNNNNATGEGNNAMAVDEPEEGKRGKEVETMDKEGENANVEEGEDEITDDDEDEAEDNVEEEDEEEENTKKKRKTKGKRKQKPRQTPLPRLTHNTKAKKLTFPPLWLRDSEGRVYHYKPTFYEKEVYHHIVRLLKICNAVDEKVLCIAPFMSLEARPPVELNNTEEYINDMPSAKDTNDQIVRGNFKDLIKHMSMPKGKGKILNFLDITGSDNSDGFRTTELASDIWAERIKIRKKSLA